MLIEYAKLLFKYIIKFGAVIFLHIYWFVDEEFLVENVKFYYDARYWQIYLPKLIFRTVVMYIVIYVVHLIMPFKEKKQKLSYWMLSVACTILGLVIIFSDYYNLFLI